MSLIFSCAIPIDVTAEPLLTASIHSIAVLRRHHHHHHLQLSTEAVTPLPTAPPLLTSPHSPLSPAMSLDIQTIITLASLLLNVKEVHGWFDSRTIQQKATVLWHVYSTMSDVLLATLWWCMRADGSINRTPSEELGHSVGFSEWTTGGYAYLFWAVLGLKLLTQFPVSLGTRQHQWVYLTYCYLITVAAHFPFIGCVLDEMQYSALVMAAGLLATMVCYVIWLLSELTFRLQAPDAFSKAHTELVAALRFGVEVSSPHHTSIHTLARASRPAADRRVPCGCGLTALACVYVCQWFYLMIMVLPFSNWQLQLPDYFLLGYAARVLMWLAYTAVMSKASTTVDEVEWLMFRPVKGGRAGEYEEVGQVEERKGQLPLADAERAAARTADADDDDSDDDSDDDDELGSGEDVAEVEPKEKPKRSAKDGATKAVARRDRQGAERSRGGNRQDSGSDVAADSGGSGGRKRASEKEKGRTAGANVQAVREAETSGGGGQSMDVHGSEAVKARVNGETVILIKKPKAAPPGTSSSSGSGSGGSASEGMHALDIDDAGNKKAEKKGR